MAKKTKPTMWEEGKTILMPKALHKKWTKALRSGKYNQGKGSLMERVYEGYGYTTNFCCLGVLCDIAGSGDIEDLGLPSPEFLMAEGVRFRNRSDKNGGNEGDGVRFRNFVDDPLLVGNKSAAAVNDSGKYDFKKIADLIDEVVQVY